MHQQPQFIHQANTVTDSCLIPSVALLVRPSSTAHFIVDCHELPQTWLFVAVPMVCLDYARVWLSFQAIVWILVLAGFCKSSHKYLCMGAFDATYMYIIVITYLQKSRTQYSF